MLVNAGGDRPTADHPLASGCDGGTVVLRLSPWESLFLTAAEAIRLAEQIRQHLVCRTTAQVDEPVVVADIPLSPAEAWHLFDQIQQLHFDQVEPVYDWLTEGF